MADNRSLIAVAAGAGVVAALAVATPTGPNAARGVAAGDTVIVFNGERPRVPKQFDRGRDLLWREIGGGGPDSLYPRRDVTIQRAFEGPSGRRRHLTVLIATVADPVDSHLDWMFDLELAGIRQAHAIAGYLPSGYWGLSPWEKPDASDNTRHQEPGVMLFRTLHGDSLSLVYFVGELPTTGIYKQAFRTALAERNAILRLTCQSPGSHVDTLPVIGPTFSGGALSLRQALDDQGTGDGVRADSITASIVSGTATADSVASLLRRAKHGRTAWIHYVATVHTDATLSRVRDGLVARMWPDSNSEALAIMTEASTTYGASSSLTNDTNHTPSAPLHIPFPLNIATLRIAYDRSHADSGSAAKRGDTRLPLQWRDPPRAAENPAPASALTMPTIDQAFEDVVRLLHTRHIRMIELDATDIRDKVFLAEQLRQRVPDVELLTREMHVLYADPAVAPNVRGLFILSTYPPGLRNQSRLTLDKKDPARRIAFASDDMEGVYNATLLQLGEGDRLADYRWPFDSRTDAGSTVPPVWVSIVGTSSIIPLRAERASVADTVGMFVGRTPGPGPDHAPRRPEVFYLAGLLTLAAVSLALVLTRSLRRGRMKNDDPSRFITSLGLMAAFLPAGAVAVGSRFEISTVSDFFTHGALSIGGAATATALVLALGIHNRIVPAVGGWLRKVILLLPIAIVVLSLIVSAALRAAPGLGDASGGELLLDRVTLLMGGVSPIVPMVLIGLGVCVWGWWDAQRLQYITVGVEHGKTPIARWLNQLERPDAAGSVNLLDASAHVQQVIRRIKNPADGFFPGLIGALIFGFATVSVLNLRAPIEDAVGIWPHWGTDALELLLQIGIAAGIVAPIWMTVQAWLIWRDLEKTLDALSRTPMYSAFERLPTFASRITELALLSFGWRARLKTLNEVANLQRQALLTFWAYPVDFPPVWHRLMSGWNVEPGQDEIAAAIKTGQEVPKRSPDGTFPPQASSLSTFRRTFGNSNRLWMRGAEEWLAVHIVIYVEWVFQYILRTTRFFLLTVVLTTLLLSSYLFYPQDFFVKTFFTIAGAGTLALIILMAAINRDATVSAITNTTPGKLTWTTGFVSNLLLIGGVPLITLLSASFPAIRGVLFAWVQPLLAALSKGN